MRNSNIAWSGCTQNGPCDSQADTRVQASSSGIPSNFAVGNLQENQKSHLESEREDGNSIVPLKPIYACSLLGQRNGFRYKFNGRALQRTLAITGFRVPFGKCVRRSYR